MRLTPRQFKEVPEVKAYVITDIIMKQLHLFTHIFLRKVRFPLLGII